MAVECSSILSRVVVHARGALVTREILLPEDLAEDIVDVDVPGITFFAQPGSARAALEASERVVSAVHTALVVPESEVSPGPTLARVRDLTARIERIADEQRVLSERRTRLTELGATPNLRTSDARKRERDVFDVRFTEALQMAALLNEKLRELDERLVRLEQEHRAVNRELEAAHLEDRQASSRDRMGKSHPTRTITVRLTGRGRPGKLLVTYAVAAARWWPAYTLRLDGIRDGAPRATWTFDAIVAQRTGEDWSAVALALSSADLVFDARLPELPSLRFGLAQPPRRPAFRPPPAGVDEMFAAYLASRPIAKGKTLPASAAAPSSTTASAIEEWGSVSDDDDTLVRDRTVALEGAAEPAMMDRPRRPPMLEGAVDSRSIGMMAPGAPPPASMSFAPAPGVSLSGRMGRRTAEEMPTVAFQSVTIDAGPPEIVPSETWGDYDALVLASADAPQRGRLVPRSDARHGGAIANAAREVDRAVDGRYRDPIESRGMFDHRYEAAGRADVPSDGRVHRVTVGTASGPARLAWRAVPSEAAEVYREAHVVNPFDTALLGGPVDVYLEGSLLTTTSIDRIDRGGAFYCGMGVDDRLKIARNVRIDEESAGLLGGSIVVTHTVEIELSSALEDPVKVTVLERVPVTDDKALEVKLVRATPAPEAYDQSDRGAPVRGGFRFDATVTRNQKTRLEVTYRLVFAQKLDIAGGSRRG